MSSLKDILNNTSKELLSESKDEVLKLFSQALSSNNDFAKKNAAKIERWIIKLSEGEIDREEFVCLVVAQKMKLDQYLNTVALKFRSETENKTNEVITIIINKVIHNI